MLANSNLQTCPRTTKQLASPLFRTRTVSSTLPSSLSACSVHSMHAPLVPTQAPVSAWGGPARCNRRTRSMVTKSFGAQHEDHAGLQDYIEVKVDSVRVSGGTSVVCLRLCQQEGLVLPLHIGEAESTALLKEINKQKGTRPLTHDLAKHLMQALGVRVTKIRITEMVNSTYYSRIHIARNGSTEEIELDGRPSDAINLAVRFEAPMYIHKRVTERATSSPPPENSRSQNESHAEVVKSVRYLLANFEDPTTILYLEKELAVQQERYQDAHALQQHILDLMTHSVPLRLMVSMEAALADGRYDEAARIRDEYKKLAAVRVVDGARLGR